MNHPSILPWLLALALVVIVVLAVKYVELQAQLAERVERQLSLFRNRELGALRAELAQAARAEAGVALERWRMESEADIRSDAVRRSSAVVSGKVTEHLTPYIGSFPYNPKDVRFLGTPVDLIVFDGLSEEEPREIIFLEVKTGSSNLSSRERRIRDLVLARRVSWKEFRVGPS
jgi:predicted Holliday junction resolvase-like endonuclease